MYNFGIILPLNIQHSGISKYHQIISNQFKSACDDAFMWSVIIFDPKISLLDVVVVVQCNFFEELCVSNARCGMDLDRPTGPFLPKEKNQA